MKSTDKYTLFLIEQAQAGRKNSYLELIGFYKRQVYIRSLQLLGNVFDAETVSREVFFRAWNNIKLVNESIPFDLWLRGLTISVAMVYYRETLKEKQNASTQTILLTPKIESDVKFLSLPLKKRQILILHDLEGYSYSDIAAILGEENYSDFETFLKEARIIIAGEKFETIDKLTEKEWLKITEDFDYWPINKNVRQNMTDTIKAVFDYRENLESLLSSYEPSDETFEKLINYFFIHGQKIVEERKKEKEIWRASFGEKKKEKEKSELISKAAKVLSEPGGKKRIAEVLSFKPRLKKIRLGFLSFAVVAALILAVVFFYRPDNFPWKVTASYGKYLIGSVENKKEIYQGDEIRTSVASAITFYIESIGAVTLKANTFVKAADGNADQTIINLSEGTIDVSTKTSDHKLTIAGKDFKIFDYGSHSELFYKKGSGRINVETGGVKVFHKGKERPVFEDYEYVFGDVAPVNIYAAPELITAVRKIKYPVKYDSNLDKVISLADEADALTIWTLLRDSDKGATGILFNKLNELFPLSENISKYEILDLNKEKLNEWLDEIEWQL